MNARGCISLFGRQGAGGSASQSEAMMVAVGFSPRGGSAKPGSRGATLEGIDWLFGSGVAPRRAPFLHRYFRGLKPTATVAKSLRDFAKTEMHTSVRSYWCGSPDQS